MNRQESASDRPRRRKGATTAGRGTPFAVDISRSRREWTLSALFLAGPLISSAHFMVVYLTVEAGCTGDGPGLNVFDPPAPVIVTLVTTAVAAIGCLATAFWGYRRWRADRRERPAGPGAEPPDRGGSLAFAGFLLSLLGFVSVLLVGVPAFFLPACLP